MTKEEFLRKSKESLKKILKKEGLLTQELETAFDKVPREEFFPEESKENAYLNNAFEIGFGQTISQPSMIFIMLKELEVSKEHKVLEIGTGSGYLTALLCELSYFVYSVEIIEELATKAEERLKKLGYNNFRIFIGDGSVGLKEFAPYDRIIVSAAAPEVPEELVSQLKPGGTLVIPIGGYELQRLVKVKKLPNGKVITEDSVMCRFVPLVGQKGFNKLRQHSH